MLFHKKEKPYDFYIFCWVAGVFVVFLGIFEALFSGPALEAEFSWFNLYFILGAGIVIGGFIIGMGFERESLKESLYWDWPLWGGLAICTVLLGAFVYIELALVIAGGIIVARHLVGFSLFVSARVGDWLWARLDAFCQLFKKPN